MKKIVKPIVIRRSFTVPVFGDAMVYIVIAENLRHEHNRIDVFDPWDEKSNWDAVVSYTNNGYFGLFMRPSHTNDCTIAHEVFHLTHRIAEWCGIPFHTENHEPFALLQGYLAAKIYKIVRKPVKPR